MLFPLPGTPTSQIPHSPHPLQASTLMMLCDHPRPALGPNCVRFPVLTCPVGRVSPPPVPQEGGATALSRCEGHRGSPMSQEEVAAPGSLESWAGLHPSVKPAEEASALTQGSGKKW